MSEPAATPAAPEERVPLRNPYGEIKTVPRSQAELALQNGYAQVTDDEVAQAKAEQSAKEGLYPKLRGAGYSPLTAGAISVLTPGGVGGTLGAAQAGGASGFSAGLIPAAEHEALKAIDPKAAKALQTTIQDLQSTRGTAYGAGEAAGMAGGALVGGALGRAGMLTPIGGLTAAGEAAEGLAGRGLAGLATRGALGRAAATGLKLGARGAVEGALYGGVHEMSEEMLGDHELNAEKIIAAAGEQGAFGALLGVGLGAGGSLAASGAKGLQGLAQGARPGIASTLRRGASALEDSSIADKVAMGYAGRVAETPEQAKLLSDAWKRRAEVFGSHEDLLERSTRAMTEHLDTALKAERAVDMVSFGQAKEGQMARLVDSAKWREARDAALGVWQDAKGVVEELMTDPTRGGSGVAVGRMGKWVEKFGNELGEIATAKDKTAVARRLFSELDDFKRAVGQNAMYGRGPFGLPEAAREFDALYHRVRGVLESEDVWGKAAMAQREVNAATQARLGTRRQFGATFTTQYGSEAGRPLYVANPEGAASYVRNLTSAKNDLKHQALTDYIRNEQGFLDTVERHYDIGPAERAEIAKAREAFRGLGETIERTSQEVTTVNKLRRLQAEESAGGIGGLFGLAGDVASRPLHTMRRLSLLDEGKTGAARLLSKVADLVDIRRAVQTVDTQIGRSARGLVDSSASGPAKLRGDRAPTGKPEDVQTRYRRAVEANARMETDAQDFVKRVTSQPIRNAPKTSASLAAAMVRSAAYLSSRRPASTAPTVLGPTPKPTTDSVTASAYLRTHEAVANPMAALKQFERGKVTPEAVQALQAVSPKMFEQLQREVVEVIGDRLAAGRPVPFQTRLRLGILLGVETDPALNPQMLAALQSSITAPPEEPGPKPKPVDLKSKPAGLDRLEDS